MIQMDVFSTARWAPYQRIDCWNELVSEVFTPQAIHARDRADFDGEIKRLVFQDIVLAEINSGAATIHHSKSHAAKLNSQNFFVEVQLAGDSTITQDGRSAQLAPGDFTLCDVSRPYEVSFDKPVSMLILSLPLAHLRRFVGYPEAITAVRMACDERNRMNQLASDFLRDMWLHLKSQHDHGMASHIGDTLLNTIACAYACLPRACCNGATLATSRRLSIMRYIEEHLSDAELSLTTIGRDCKVSTRYAHRLFASQGETIRQYILRRRLEVCGQMLANPAQSGRSITAIATDMGFSSLAQFCTVFRERYGKTPGEYRAAHELSDNASSSVRSTRRKVMLS